MKGITVNGEYLRLQFTWQGKRYRITSNYKLGQEKQAGRLLSAILFDLENGKFNIEVYCLRLRNVNYLESLDPKYIADKQDPLLSVLLMEHLEALEKRVSSGLLELSTFRNYRYIIVPHFY